MAEKKGFEPSMKEAEFATKLPVDVFKIARSN